MRKVFLIWLWRLKMFYQSWAPTLTLSKINMNSFQLTCQEYQAKKVSVPCGTKWWWVHLNRLILSIWAESNFDTDIILSSLVSYASGRTVGLPLPLELPYSVPWRNGNYVCHWKQGSSGDRNSHFLSVCYGLGVLHLLSSFNIISWEDTAQKLNQKLVKFSFPPLSSFYKRFFFSVVLQLTLFLLLSLNKSSF